MRRLRPLSLLTGSVMTLAVFALALGPPGEAAFPGKNGKIAFVKSAGGNDEIFVMNADGSGQQNLTSNAAHDTQPAWRADGNELLFTSVRSGLQRIWKVLGTGGTAEPVTLIAGNPQESSPAWGPDARITWEAGVHGGYEIYAQGTDGQPKRLTFNDPISDRAPAWSPDGTKIAFWSARNQNRDIFVMNADGSGVEQLTTYAESDRDPVWSPDGTKIAFERTLEGGNSDILVMNATGTNVVNVTNSPGDDRNAAWSPDGTKIAFRSGRSGNQDIWVMDADGSNPRNLTNDAAFDDDPDWQPLSQDQDFDGLLDDWEINGYDANGDGKIDVDLKRMGADPRHKDIFIEVDKMLGHPFQPEAAKMVVDAFAIAPVINPDEKPGITMHIDNGSGTVMDAKTGARWGTLSRSNPLPHVEVLGKYADGGGYPWDAFDALKKKHLPPERARIFHYAIFGHRYGSADEGSSGISRGFAASDFIVTLADFCPGDLECPGTAQEQAHTFMHELGHNLDLRHGGDDDVNHKPNYLSVMSYRYQFPGLIRDGNPGVLDYSRFSPAGTGGVTNTIAPLDENALSEAAGLGALGGTIARFQTTYVCRVWDGRQFINRGTRTVPVRPGGPVDWDCDGRVPEPGTMKVDLNADDAAGPLTAFNDWEHLVYEGGSIGAGGAARILPRTTPGGDARVSELVKSARIVLGDAKKPTVQVAGPRSGTRRRPVRLVITARDNKGLALLVVTIDGKSYQLVAKKRQRLLRAQATVVRRGRRVVRVAVADRAGNESRKITVRVRIR